MSGLGGTDPTRILFVCLGNICRSPAAEAVLRDLANQAGIGVQVDSAGIGDWHVGRPPHPPMAAAAARRGLDLSSQRARQVGPRDFGAFHLILAADRSVLQRLVDIRPSGSPIAVQLLAPLAGDGQQDVPDPYFTDDYEGALDLIEAACAGLLSQLQ